MNNILLSKITNNNINIKNKTVILGVSTGVDSMVLLDTFLDIREKMNVNIVVCHVNHNKRDKSMEEETFIKEYCHQKDIKLEVLRFSDSDAQSNNFEEFAREKRISFFKYVCKKNKSNLVFLAHHLNDDLETSIMKIIRGASLNAITGIKMISRMGDVFFIRPFIDVPKREIYTYASKKKIKFFEDKSNLENTYTRNRVRNKMIPLLLEENPSFLEAFKELKQGLIYCVNLKDEYRNHLISNKFNVDENKISFKKELFLEIDEYMQKEILFSLLFFMRFSKENIDHIIDIIKSNKTNSIENYLSIAVIKEYDDITILKNNYLFKETYKKIEKCGEYRINDNIILKVSKTSKKSIKNIGNIKHICYNDYSFPFIVRTKKEGDKIAIKGGSKKIKDLFIDEKIPARKREEALILLDKDDNILSLLGIKKSIILNDIKDKKIEIEYIEREDTNA